MELVPLNNGLKISLPALVGRAGERAARRFLEFFTVHIRNVDTREAYSHAGTLFLAWCEARAIFDLGAIQSIHVACYIEQLEKESCASTAKQHLACIRMLFDWLVTGQVLPSNPVHNVWGLRHTVIKATTTVVSPAEARDLLDTMDGSTVVGLRDRALVAVMAFTFVRVSVVVDLKVEDYYPRKRRWWLRLREKNGKVHQMRCHHKLEAFLHEYLAAAEIRDDGKGWLFRTAIGKTGKLSKRPVSQTDIWCMVQRRVGDAKIETAIDGHNVHAAGITDSLPNGGKLEVAQRVAGHPNAENAGLYDRTNAGISASEVERLGI